MALALKNELRIYLVLESSDLEQGCHRGDPCCGWRKVFSGAKDPGIRAGATFRGASAWKTLRQVER